MGRIDTFIIDLIKNLDGSLVDWVPTLYSIYSLIHKSIGDKISEAISNNRSQDLSAVLLFDGTTLINRLSLLPKDNELVK